MIGELAAGARIAQAAAEGFGALRRLQPEYGRFWSSFDSKVKPESRDLPWDRIKQLRLDPAFVGNACGLIRGDHAKRKQMRQQIAALAEPPEGGRYDAEEIVERIMRAADDSAVAAARDERTVTAQRGRLVEGRIDELEANIYRKLEELRTQLAAAHPEPPQFERRSRAARPHRAESEDGRAPRELSTTGQEQERKAVGEAVTKLGEILESDGAVASFLSSRELEPDQLGYRPDFAVSDDVGTSWFIEVKSDSALTQTQTRRQLRVMAKRIGEASEHLSADWRLVLLTPAQMRSATSWPEIKAAALDPFKL